MGAGIVTTKNFGSLEDLYSAQLGATEEQLGSALLDVIANIQLDTANSQSYTGRGFDAYTPEYATRKSKAGSGGRSTRPNLNFSGRMMESMRVSMEREGQNLIGIIGFPDETEEKKAIGNNEKRSFFGLSSRSKARLDQVEIKLR